LRLEILDEIRRHEREEAIRELWRLEFKYRSAFRVRYALRSTGARGTVLENGVRKPILCDARGERDITCRSHE
jgi:hypothetical protein